jgi:hypothetical protein
MRYVDNSPPSLPISAQFLLPKPHLLAIALPHGPVFASLSPVSAQSSTVATMMMEYNPEIVYCLLP